MGGSQKNINHYSKAVQRLYFIKMYPELSKKFQFEPIFSIHQVGFVTPFDYCAGWNNELCRSCFPAIAIIYFKIRTGNFIKNLSRPIPNKIIKKEFQTLSFKLRSSVDWLKIYLRP